MQQELAIEMKHISKTFGELKANDDVNLSVRQGEVHALLGENGAGKSTLMNMLSGIYTPDAGTIRINGKDVHFSSPKDSIKMGIGMIHQHFKLVDVMTAKENILIGQPSSLFVHGKKLSKQIKELSDQYGLDLDPDKKVYDMSVGEKQTLEIMKVLYRGARILIMDEPVSHVDAQGRKIVLGLMKKLRATGKTLLVVEHDYEQLDFADQWLVIENGRLRDFGAPEEIRKIGGLL